MKVLFIGSNKKIEKALAAHFDKVIKPSAELEETDEQISIIVIDAQSIDDVKGRLAALHADFKFHRTRIFIIDVESSVSVEKDEDVKAHFIRTTDTVEMLNQIDNISNKELHESLKPNLTGMQFKIKRVFDIMVSGFALLLLSPIFLILAVIIKLDSKGPVFFVSKRVGTGYKVFDLYKFRTMKVGAEHLIKDMKDQNMYAQSKDKQEEMQAMFSDDNILIDDTGFVTTEQATTEDEEAVFMKFQNDPRITRLGNFLRNSSLDELPQLINIFKGDMSIVGNRPLPLYEAERLTTDTWAMRFLAPAGLTGLWQVTKRGKGDMSNEERIQLDNMYAMDFSFLNDIKIMIQTVPAMLQKENV